MYQIGIKALESGKMPPRKTDMDLTLEQMQQQLSRLPILEQGMTRMEMIEQSMNVMQKQLAVMFSRWELDDRPCI